MKHTLKYLLILIIMTTPTVFADNLKAQFQKNYDHWRTENKVPGSVLLIQSPSYQDILTSGTMTMKGKNKIQADTLFGVGSITKTFVSALILKLEAENKLKISDPMGKYLPQYPRWKNITIQQLLNMTGGIFNYMNDENYKKDLDKNFQKKWNDDQLIQISYEHTDDFKPGKGWNYSNTDYLLLGKIIERITHQSLSESLKTAFFTPLHMNHTVYVENEYSIEVFKKIASGYYNGKVIKSTLPGNLGSAAGGMVMDAKDLDNFISHLLIKKDLLSQMQLNEMLTGIKIPLGKIKSVNSQYGLGLTITNSKKFGKIIWYTGVTPYHTAIYEYIPSQRLLIIVLASFNRHYDKNYDLLFPQKALIQDLLNLIGNHHLG